MSRIRDLLPTASDHSGRLRGYLHLFVLLCFPLCAQAATFTVSNTNGSGAGSLRQAILDANANGVIPADTIAFNIPGSGPHLIAIGSRLPVVGGGVTIDGFSQPGSSANTRAAGAGSNAVLRIVLHGGGSPQGTVGLVLDGTASRRAVVQGLVINNLLGTAAHGIEIRNGAIVRGCHIGTNPAGTASSTLQGSAIRVLAGASGITLGGATTADLNITGTAPIGIHISAGAGDSGGLIEGNLIGIGADGQDIGHNGTAAVSIDRPGMTLRNNEIARNGSSTSTIGVLLGSGAGGSVLEGNRIGLSRIGNPSGDGRANTGVALAIAGASDVRVGSPGAPNELIGGTLSTSALEVYGDASSGQRNALADNRFLAAAPGGLPIDLRTAVQGGVSPNDPGDIDVGPNAFQNFPLLNQAARTGSSGPVSIAGTLHSTPTTSFRLHFYAVSSAQVGSLGHGHGEFRSANSVDVLTNASGNASFGPLQVDFAEGASVLSQVSATSTRLQDGVPVETSEFAANLPIVNIAPNVFVVNSTNDPGFGVCDAAECSLREAILLANATPNGAVPDRIHFAIPGNPSYHSILLAGEPPTITETLVIDGYSQPASAPNSDASGVGSNAVIKVEVLSTTSSVFVVSAPGVEFRGLAFNGPRIFYGAQATDGVVEGCWLGLHPDGSSTNGNASTVRMRDRGRFGGPSPAQRNLLLDRSAFAIAASLLTADGDQVLVQNNLFQLLPDGRTPEGSATTAFEGNVRYQLLANVFAHGSRPGFSADFLTLGGIGEVIDNAIGESWDGQTRFATFDSVVLTSTGKVSMRSTARGISGTHSPAVKASGAGHRIEQPIRNVLGVGVGLSGIGTSVLIAAPISGNAGLGIDLGNDGVTANDPSDADVGPNGLQNYPVLHSATRSGTAVEVFASLNSLPSTLFRIRWCAVIEPDPSGHGECELLLAETHDVVTTANGSNNFSVSLDIPAGYPWLSATASRVIDAEREETSEFAATIPIVGSDPLIFADGFE